MHELSIASSIVDTVLKEIDKQNLKKVLVIKLRVGVLTDIVPDSLLFGFEALTSDTVLKDTKLEIETVPIKGVCNECSNYFEVEEFTFVCPNCSSYDIEMKQGNELDIAHLEVDD
jgi:hydrogenase nickel incorporation protein HypA/HybF